MASETIPNASQSTVHGAGIQTAQMIAAMGVQVVITGNIGPNAFQALSASGIKVITGTAGTVRQAVTKFMKGELKGTGLPTVQGHFGMGRGRAGGRGGGWGRTN
jgi:predicted Fe-Mo cluster-binding NifX family protein